MVEFLKTGVEYILHEVTAPNGYNLTADTSFIIDEYGEVTCTGNKTYDEEGNLILLIEDEMKKLSATVV